MFKKLKILIFNAIYVVILLALYACSKNKITRGTTIREIHEIKGRNYLVIPHAKFGSASLVYDDITIDVKNCFLDAQGQPFQGQALKVRPTTNKAFIKKRRY